VGRKGEERKGRGIGGEGKGREEREGKGGFNMCAHTFSFSKRTLADIAGTELISLQTMLNFTFKVVLWGLI